MEAKGYNVSKSAVMVFTRESVDDAWKWGERILPGVSKYTNLGVDFTSVTVHSVRARQKTNHYST